MQHPKPRLFALVLPLALGACAEDAPLEDANAAGDWVPTSVGELQYEPALPAPHPLGPPGFDLALDVKRAPCLAPPEGFETDQPLRAKEYSQEATLTFIDSRETLENELGLNAGLKAKAVAAPVGIDDATFGIVNKYSESSNDMYFLLKTTASYKVTTGSLPLEFTEDALEILPAEAHWRRRGGSDEEAPTEAELDQIAQEFLERCGSNYVDGATYEGAIYALVRYHSYEENDSTAIDTSLRASGTIEGVAEVSPNLGISAESVKNAENVRLEVTVRAHGFDYDGSLTEIVASASQKDQESIIGKLVEIEQALAEDVTNDYCHDSYEPNETCPDGRAPVGFLDHHRSARSTQVLLGNYFRSGELSGIATRINQMQAATSDVMGLCLDAYSGMVDRFRAGIERFNDDARKFNYHHIDVDRAASYAYDREELMAAAEAQERAFDPDRRDSHSRAIQRYMEDCRNSAIGGSYDYCLELHDEVIDSPEYADHLDALDNTRPIVPLLYDVVDNVKHFRGAESACGYEAAMPLYYPGLYAYPYASYSMGGFYREERAWRLPKAHEVDRLSVAYLENPDVPHSEDEWDQWDLYHSMWFQDEEFCPHSQYDANGAGLARVDFDGSIHYGCIYNDNYGFLNLTNSLRHRKATTLCVPDLGPYPEEYLATFGN